MAKDPVCGMQVDEKMAIATSVYQEQTYYFCAKACKTAFDREPEKYLGEKGVAQEGGGVFHGDASREEAVRGRWREILVGVVTLAGILLLVWGISGLRELMVVGKVPAEMLGRRVGFTVVPLVVGLALIVWCLVGGIGWARGKGRR